jgi:hypothetical protein
VPEKCEVRRLHAAGLSDREIAEACRCSRSRVTHVRAMLKIRPHRFRWTDELFQAVLKRLENGESRKAVAESLGVPTFSIHNKIHAAGLGREYDREHDATGRMSAAWAMFAKGLTPPQVAAAMGLHVKTVCGYRRRMPAWWADDFGKECESKQVVTPCADCKRPVGHYAKGRCKDCYRKAKLAGDIPGGKTA